MSSCLWVLVIGLLAAAMLGAGVGLWVSASRRDADALRREAAIRAFQEREELVRRLRPPEDGRKW